MADNRFFKNLGPFSVKELAEACNGKITGCDPSMMIKDVAPLEKAGERDVSFMYSLKYKQQMQDTKAAVCVIPAEGVEVARNSMGLIIAKDPKRAAAMVIEKFYPPHYFQPAIDDKAVVHKTVSLGKGCRIDAGAVINAGAKIGDGTWVKAGAFIDENVEIGSHCVIGVNASLTHCILGNGVITYAGVRIGEDGFGFALGAQGHKKVPQIGLVEIGNDVEIGANTCIDRGAFENTVIGDGCRIDNLVQIGHNVKMGRGCYIVSQVGIAGSCVIEDFVVMGGQAGIADNLTIGMGSQIAAQSGVPSSLPAGSKVMGNPAVPARDFFKQAILLQRMVKDTNTKKGEKNKND